MEENNKDWATPTLKEAPYYYPGMTPEEYEIEREYYYQNWNLVLSGKYVPLWRQKAEK